MSSVNLDEVKEKIIEKLKSSGWANLLKGFIYSSEFDLILNQLRDNVNDGKRFTPPLKEVFRSFEECPLDKLKVVLIGQDPYPYLGVADGLAFSCGHTLKVQPSLRYIFSEINKTVYNEDLDHNPDLTRWANQGILLLNKALTTEVGKIGKHMNIWSPFIGYTLDMLNLSKTGLVYLLMGNQAADLEDMITDSHKIIKVSHPASASYSGTGIWNCKDCFNEVNNFLSENEKIKW